MDKVEKDGKVAVLYSPRYGAGWSTWADHKDRETLCMDRRIVQPFLDGNFEEALAAAHSLVCGLYSGGFEELKVVWIPVGTPFRITEYDGYESIEYSDKIDYFFA